MRCWPSATAESRGFSGQCLSRPLNDSITALRVGYARFATNCSNLRRCHRGHDTGLRPGSRWVAGCGRLSSDSSFWPAAVILHMHHARVEQVRDDRWPLYDPEPSQGSGPIQAARTIESRPKVPCRTAVPLAQKPQSERCAALRREQCQRSCSATSVRL